MKKLNPRVTADIEGEFVVFLIGMRINRFRDIRQWWTAGSAMLRMLAELRAHPALGLLHAEGGWFFNGPRISSTGAPTSSLRRLPAPPTTSICRRGGPTTRSPAPARP